jgi:hypothetical protein
MASASEFHRFARECMDWARAARSEDDRLAFLQMAQTWLAAAARLELTEGVDLGGADIGKTDGHNHDGGSPPHDT